MSAKTTKTHTYFRTEIFLDEVKTPTKGYATNRTSTFQPRPKVFFLSLLDTKTPSYQEERKKPWGRGWAPFFPMSMVFARHFQKKSSIPFLLQPQAYSFCFLSFRAKASSPQPRFQGFSIVKFGRKAREKEVDRKSAGAYVAPSDPCSQTQTLFLFCNLVS